MSLNRLFGMALIVLALTINAFAQQAIWNSPENLKLSLEPDNGVYMLANLEDRAGTVSIPRNTFRNLAAFELAGDGQHFRRAYPDSRGRLSLAPSARYVLYEVDSLADKVISEDCGLQLTRMSADRKLDLLGAQLADFRKSRATAQIKSISEAYQALLGLELKLEMRYPSESSRTDFRLFAGRDFEAVCTISITGREKLTDGTLRIIPPDEWRIVSGVRRLAELHPGKSERFTATIQAPDRSTFRTNRFPVIAELEVNHNGNLLIVHYPIRVEMSDPISAELNIVSADSTRLQGNVMVKSLYPGMEFQGITTYPFLAGNLELEPARQTFNLRDRKSFKVSYNRTGATEGFVQRAVTLVLRVDGAHLVRLRTVMEGILPLGVRSRMAALWMNEANDGLTEAAEIGGIRCRKTVENELGNVRYIYFAASPNFPVSGNSYVTVTYFDGPEGAFHLEYDSADASATGEGTYKPSAEVVKLGGTDEWKQATFMLPDILFANRQKSDSDFRLAMSNADLFVSDIAISKYPGIK